MDVEKCHRDRGIPRWNVRRPRPEETAEKEADQRADGQEESTSQRSQGKKKTQTAF